MRRLKLPSFKRLFWKIFFSLWLSSAAVMLLTMLVVAQLAERDSYQDKVKYQIRDDIERLVNFYEASPRFRALLERKQRREMRKKDWQYLRGEEALTFFQHRKNRPPVRIYDDSGTLIMGSSKTQREGSFSFTVRAKSQRDYKVAVDLKHPRASLARWQGFIFSVQALLILVSSTLASFIISAIVVRPINQLRRNVAKLHSGDFSQRTAQKLQRRGDEIGDFARELNQMAEQVEKTLVGQQRLFQNVSHELRAPLARLMAASGIIEQQVGADHPAVTRVQTECERLTLLIDELLSLARLDQQQQSNQPLTLAPLLQKVIEDGRYLAGPQQVLTLTCDASLGSVVGVASLLERALGNIVNNALKYAGESARVELTASVSDAHVVLTVCDNGPGVPEGQLSQLCEPFFRLDVNSQGHGLGLGIARQALEMQGASLVLSNASPSGLCAEIKLQRARG
ncbi:MAG: ATP-binding protein [Pseudomonadales bacterium]